jgi:phosphoadenosine phosphosulfate reductase
MSAFGLYARETAGFSDRLAQTVGELTDAAAAFAGRVVQASSLGAEDMVITDLIARHQLGIPVATLETGMLHPQTLELLQRTQAHYGLAIEVYRPVETSVVHFVQTHGDQAMYQSLELRKACCGVRKMEPLGRMLAGRGAWITGLRREQSDARGQVLVQDRDDQGRIKYNPLAEWSWADVWHYLQSHGVPYNPLHDAFMPSIGCAPCTRAIAVGEDFRSGRWWWENESAKECGLHVSHPAPNASAL